MFATPTPVPPQMAFVRSSEWRDIELEVETVAQPSGERQRFQVYMVGGRCLLPWLRDAESVAWTLRDRSQREARIRRSRQEASEGRLVELVVISRPPLD
jgi:hypothetical protein